jgi:hypothetical protein
MALLILTDAMVTHLPLQRWGAVRVSSGHIQCAVLRCVARRVLFGAQGLAGMVSPLCVAIHGAVSHFSCVPEIGLATKY